MRTQLQRAWATYLLLAIAALVGATAGFAYAETAAIKIAVTPQKLESTVALNKGGLNLVIQHIDATVTETVQGTATSTVPTAATYATGQVRFLLVCPASVVAPPCQAFTMPAGTVVVSVRHVRFVTTSPAVLRPPPASQTATVGIRAIASGAAGNTGPGTIMTIEYDPRPNVAVFNPYAVDGGADAGVAPVIQQSDVDAAQAALAAKVSDELGSAILANASGMAYVVDGPPSLDFTSDHAAGDQAAGFTLTVTGKLGAEAFSNSAAQTILRTVLHPAVWPGYTLPADPIRATYRLTQAADGSELLMADAVGYAVPKPSMAAIRARLKGLSLADARSRLRHDFPGSSIDMRTKPLAFPWLPFVQDHINLTVFIEPPA